MCHACNGLSRSVRRLTTALGLAVCLAAPAAAVITGGQCVQARGGNSCTANDVTFILVGLGVQDDGCVNSSDTLTIKLGGQLQNTSAGTRYDIGMYIYDYLGTETASAVSQGYAYNGTSCAREALKPGGTTGDLRCTFDSPPGSLNLLGGSGPFFSAEGDACGDLLKVQTSSTCDSNGNGKWDDSFTIFTDPITLKCADGTNGAADGFADIPTCATWGQNVDEVDSGDAGSTCDGESEVLPGTPSKCNCQNINSTVPIPSLSLSCSCSPTTVRSGGFTNGASTACTVTFTNATSCTINSSTEERFRCAAASFLQLDTVASSTPNGSYFFGYTTGTGNAATETTAGDVYQPSAGTIRWTPRDTNATGGGTTLGVVGQSETGTLSFNYFVDPAVPSGTTINFTTTAYWANSNAQGSDHTFSSRVAQSALTATCGITTSNAATWARVASFGARRQDGKVVVEWETAGEVGTVGFEVERLDPSRGRYVPIVDGAVPAISQLPGGRYRLVDAGAPRDPQLSYRLVEVDQQGRREILGPYRVEVERERPRQAAIPAGGFTAAAKPVSARLVRSSAEHASAAVGSKAVTAAAGGPRRARLSVVGKGMAQVAARDLAIALGVPQAQAVALIRTGHLRLTRGGQEVAWELGSNGDKVLFYSPGLASSYTDTDVFFAELTAGRAMAKVPVLSGGGGPPSFADTLHLEEDAIPTPMGPMSVEDFWIWKSFFPGYPGFDHFAFGVTVPSPAASGGTLAVTVVGFAAVQRADLRLNGRWLGELAWEGSGSRTLTIAVPAGVLRDGFNAIEVVALEAARGFWVDSFDLNYSHRYRAAADRVDFSAAAGQVVDLSGFSSSDIAVYDLAAPLEPRRLEPSPGRLLADGSWGVSFLAPGSGPFTAVSTRTMLRATAQASVPADLRHPQGGGAEYLVITPVDLRSQAQRLVDLRAAQGLSALRVDLDDVMDVFAEGVYDPEAIRRFLAYAVESWPTPPRYVALAGKGTYDPRNRLGLYSNLLPPLLVATQDGIVPADAAYGDVDDDGVPEVAIGRIPATNGAELGAYVDKVALYEDAPSDSWMREAVVISDDNDKGGDFRLTSRQLESLTASGLQVSEIALPAAADAAQLHVTRGAVSSAFTQGRLLMSYVGHGGLDRLAAEGILLSSDVESLGNGPRLPVLTALTCLIAQFAYPSVTSLGEELVLDKRGGAAAVFGPTWLAHNDLSGKLGAALTPELSSGEGRLGDRLLRGLQAYAKDGSDAETLRVYTLLGDPALDLRE